MRSPAVSIILCVLNAFCHLLCANTSASPSLLLSEGCGKLAGRKRDHCLVQQPFREPISIEASVKRAKYSFIGGVHGCSQLYYEIGRFQGR